MSIDGDQLCSDKLAFQRWLAVFQQHRDDLTQVALKLFHRGMIERLYRAISAFVARAAMLLVA